MIKIANLQKLILVAITFTMLAPAVHAQLGGKPGKVNVIHAEELNTDMSANIQRLRGEVELRQDSTFLYCDSATIKNDFYVTAQGKVVIQQTDTTSLFSDSLNYNGKSRIAKLIKSVVFVNGKQRLFTDALQYNLNKKVATYNTGGLLDNGRSQLSSKKGSYSLTDDTALFQDSVVVVDSNFTLKADSLRFNTQTETAFFSGPTRIKQNDAEIYCEGGKYDIPKQLAVFEKNAQYRKDTTRAAAELMQYDGNKREVLLSGKAYVKRPDLLATADRIRYEELTDKYFLEGNAIFIKDGQTVKGSTIEYDAKNDQYITTGRAKLQDSTQILEADKLDFNAKTGLGYAIGNVYWQDTVQKIAISSEEAFYDDDCQRLLAVGQRPVFMNVDGEGDTMYMSADTLLSYGDCSGETDERTLLAYHDVRIYKSKIQGRCDSLRYTSRDSQFIMYHNPILWSDTSQFMADTIRIQMKNNALHRIYLLQNALVINSPDLQYFNQIKGRNMTAYMADNTVQKLQIVGNAESIYYILDEEDRYVGPNKAASSEMWIYFKDSQIANIKLYRQPAGETTPMMDANHNALRLKGFDWEMDCRPKSVADIKAAVFCE